MSFELQRIHSCQFMHDGEQAMIKFKQKPISKPAQTCRDNVVVKLADTMRVLAFAGDNVSPETLAHHGFSREVVDRFGERAATLARRLSVKQIASNA